MIILKTAKDSVSSLFGLFGLFGLNSLDRDFLQSEDDFVEIPRLIPVSRTIVQLFTLFYVIFILAPFLFSPSTRTK